MKLHKWKTIRRRIEGASEENEKGKDLSSLEDTIKAMDIYPQSPLSSSDAREQLDAEHNPGYNKE